MKKRLTLTRETISDLTPGDLTDVVGAAAVGSRELIHSCPVLQCTQEISLLCRTTFNTCDC